MDVVLLLAYLAFLVQRHDVLPSAERPMLDQGLANLILFFAYVDLHSAVTFDAIIAPSVISRRHLKNSYSLFAQKIHSRRAIIKDRRRNPIFQPFPPLPHSRA